MSVTSTPPAHRGVDQRRVVVVDDRDAQFELGRPARLVLVGWNLARFRLGEAQRTEGVRGLLTAVRRIAAPKRGPCCWKLVAPASPTWPQRRPRSRPS